AIPNGSRQGHGARQTGACSSPGTTARRAPEATRPPATPSPSGWTARATHCGSSARVECAGRLFSRACQRLHVVRGKREPGRPNEALELLERRRARDRRGHALARDQPRHGHFRGRRVMPLRNVVESAEDALAAVVEILADDALSARALRGIFGRAILAGQKTGCEREIRDDAEALGDAQIPELALVARPGVEVVLGLQHAV